MFFWRNQLRFYFSIGTASLAIFASSHVAAQSTDTTLRATDFDGDGKSDYALWDPEAGRFTVRRSGTGALDQINLSTQRGNIAVSGLFDSDGITDLGTFNPTLGSWTLRYGASGSTSTLNFGKPSDLPVPASYFGSTRTDLAVFDKRTAEWTLRNAIGGGKVNLQVGEPGDLPVPADYDGDGLADPATFRNGRWTIRRSSTEDVVTLYFGLPGDLPVPADYLASGHANLAIFRPGFGQFFVRADDGSLHQVTQHGLPGDVPLVLHGDGNLKGDLSVYRPYAQTFYTLSTALSGSQSFSQFTFGAQTQSSLGLKSIFTDEFCALYPEICSFCTQYPIYCEEGGGDPGDGGIGDGDDGDGGIGGGDNSPFPPSTPSIAPTQGAYPVAGNTALRRSVVGDFTGDGRSDIVFLSTDDAGYELGLKWTVLDVNTGSTSSFTFGLSGDKAVAGPTYFGGRWRPVVVRRDEEAGLLRWYTLTNTGQVQSEQYGFPDDDIFFADMDGDGVGDKVVSRAGTDGDPFRYWFIKRSTANDVIGVTFGFATDKPFLGDTGGMGTASFGVTRVGPDGGLYWFSQDLRTYLETGQLNPQPVLFGLGWEFDKPLPPGDFNADGVAEPAIVRNEGGNLMFYSRPLPDVVAAVPLGLAGDRALFGEYSGAGFVERAVYRPSNRTVYVLRGSGIVQAFQAPDGARKIVMPDGRALGTDPSLDDQKIQCDILEPMKDGAKKGRLWKPEREGGNSPGDATVLVPQDYNSLRVDKVLIIGANGDKVGHAKLRYDYGAGGRAVWDVQQNNSSLAPYKPLIVQFKLKDGGADCFQVPDPYKRWD